jgi:hypothetical protein
VRDLRPGLPRLAETDGHRLFAALHLPTCALPDFNVPSLYSCMTFPTVLMPLVDELVFAVVFLGVLSFALGI